MHNLTELRASLLLLGAENEALLNQNAQAVGALTEARAAMGLHTMSKMGEIAARFHYLAALAYFQGGKVNLGEPEIEQSITLERDSSKWLFQIGVADRFVKEQGLGAHRALKLYETLLRDPLPIDWASRPMETIAVMSTPHIGVYEHWFENTLDSGMELSLEVADRTRRHRFFTTMPLGGRLLSLRWTLEAPSDALDRQSQLQRQNLLAKYPKYEDLAKQVRKLRGELTSSPLVADDVAATRKQAELLAEIAKLSGAQEVLLREMALRREASDLLFPPMYSTKDVQASLAPKQDMLIFFATHNNLYAWLMSKERYVGWKIEAPQGIEKRISTLLRAMGNYDGTRELQQNQLDESWRVAARDLTEMLTANAKASSTKINLSTNIDELIVVPDGALWYLPFEALLVSPNGASVSKSRDGKELVPLITKSRIRYLPTMGLAMPERLGRNPSA
ncbi:MAG TPA: hypothetical protein VKB78_00960, partial [Pirellulales bacterium]|nr:hypothetical protein [Pirellulales bacterium]